MKIFLLGANGAIGSLILNKALNNGDVVTAYVRKIDSLQLTHKNLTVVVGNLENETLIRTNILEADIVISGLGPSMDMSRKVKSTPIANVHDMILKIMEEVNKVRFITIGTTTMKAQTDVKHFSNTILPLIPKLLFPTGYAEYIKMGGIMRKSKLDWTVVRFLDPNAKHKSDNYRVALDGKTNKTKISRENIANFVYKVATENTFIRQMPLIFH